jgi:hypothetical protein
LAPTHIETRYKRIREFGNEVWGPQFLTQREDKQLSLCLSLADVLTEIFQMSHSHSGPIENNPQTGAPRGVTLDHMRMPLASGNGLHTPCGDQSHTYFMLSVAYHTFIQPNKPSLEGIPVSS